MIELCQDTDELIAQGSRLLKHLPSLYANAESRSPLLAMLALWHKLYREFEDLREFAGEMVDARKAHDGPPHDFLAWLAHWVALDPADEIFFPDLGQRDRPRLRRAVERAVSLYTNRSTVKGLLEMAQVFLDEEISIQEWAWPSGLDIGLSSSIGLDTFLGGHEDVSGSFVVTMRAPATLSTDNTALHWLLLALVGRSKGSVITFYVSEPPTREDLTLLTRARRLRRLLDAEKPAHADCFIVL